MWLNNVKDDAKEKNIYNKSHYYVIAIDMQILNNLWEVDIDNQSGAGVTESGEILMRLDVIFHRNSIDDYKYF